MRGFDYLLRQSTYAQLMPNLGCIRVWRWQQQKFLLSHSDAQVRSSGKILLFRWCESDLHIWSSDATLPASLLEPNRSFLGVAFPLVNFKNSFLSATGTLLPTPVTWSGLEFVAHSLVLVTLFASLARWYFGGCEYHFLSRLCVSTTTNFLLPNVAELLSIRNVLAHLLKIVWIQI